MTSFFRGGSIRDNLAHLLAMSYGMSGAVEVADDLLAQTGISDEITRLRAENKRLRAALRECADDLEAEVTARYPGDSLDYPVMQARYERDMGPVVRAREALEATDDT